MIRTEGVPIFMVHLSPIEPWCAMPLQTVKIQISWLLSDLDLHCLSLFM